MKRTLLVLFILMLGANALSAQEASPIPTYPENTITVNGFGTAYGEPDVVYIELGVENVNADLATAFTQTAEAMNSVIQALRDLEISEDDIQTTGVNVVPEEQFNPQDMSRQGERVYRVRNTVRVTLRDVAQIESVISASVSAGANTIYNLNFGIEDTQALEQEARLDAVEDARTRAQQLADAVGVTLGRPIIITESLGGGGYPPQPLASIARFDMAQPVSPGQLSVSIGVQITFALEGA